jgi:hypothetical protein
VHQPSSSLLLPHAHAYASQQEQRAPLAPLPPFCFGGGFCFSAACMHCAFGSDKLLDHCSATYKESLA